jgi:hypothetical protein
MIEELMTRLEPLRGSWAGTGAGDYPTIDAFRYQEQLTFEFAPSYPMIFYQQRAQLLPSLEPSHWESGFIRPLEDGLLEISNSQDSGRVEVLRGPATSGPDGPHQLRLLLDHVALSHDDRLAGTRREFTLDGDVLTYVVSMATHTTPTPQLQQHLRATLQRVKA